MGDCQNYGPFWVPVIIQHLIFRVPQEGTIILTTTHMEHAAFLHIVPIVHGDFPSRSHVGEIIS